MGVARCGRAALLVGLCATLVVAAGHWIGLDGPAELYTLDLRFKHLSPAHASGDIVHVDIDDASLQEAGRWPWPRRQLAGIVDLLTECGAKTVALDIEMPEPQELRFATPSDSTYAGHSEIINLVPPQFDDKDFCDMLERHGNIFVPMDFNPQAVSTDSGGGELQAVTVAGQLRELLRQDPQASLEEAKRYVCGQGQGQTRAASQAAADFGARFDEKLFQTAYLRARSLLEMEKFAIDPGAVKGYPLHEGPLTTPLVVFAQSHSP